MAQYELARKIFERVWLDRIATAQEQGISTKAWDEAKHRRHSKGDGRGGEFAPKGDSGIVSFVAPAIDDPTGSIDKDTDKAIRQLDGERHANQKRIMEDVDKQLGLKSTHENAVGVWSDGAENSLAIRTDSDDYDLVKYATAIKAQIARQKDAIIFDQDDKGKAYLYTVSVKDRDIRNLRQQASESGLEYHTIQEDGKDGSKVYVFDSSGSGDYDEKVDAFAKKVKAHDAERERGHGEFLTNEYNSRSKASARYDEIIEDYQTRFPDKRHYGRTEGDSGDNRGRSGTEKGLTAEQHAVASALFEREWSEEKHKRGVKGSGDGGRFVPISGGSGGSGGDKPKPGKVGKTSTKPESKDDATPKPEAKTPEKPTAKPEAKESTKPQAKPATKPAAPPVTPQAKLADDSKLEGFDVDDHELKKVLADHTSEPVSPKPEHEFHPDVDDDADGDGVTDSARVGVPGMSVPPPPAIGRIPNLTPEERHTESLFISEFEKDPEGIARKFHQAVLETTKPGEAAVFGTDDAKGLTAAWSDADQTKRSKNRATLNTPLHNTANAIAKKAFLSHLDTLNPGDEVLVTVGGCGAGKGYALKKVPQALAMKANAKAVWDSAGDQNATENPWIQKEVEARGLKASYVYVHANPEFQWADPERGVIKRADDPADGRMVDAKVFADSYAIGARNHQAFYEKHKDNPNAKFVFLVNKAQPELLPGIPPESLKIDRHKLAKFATDAVLKAKANGNIKRGALMGARIWGDK